MSNYLTPFILLWNLSKCFAQISEFEQMFCSEKELAIPTCETGLKISCYLLLELRL